MLDATDNTKPTLPNLLIIGAAKSGTTSLANYLSLHPQVYIVKGNQNYQEPSYFASPEAGGVQSWEEYLELFSETGDYLVRGEKSVPYLFDRQSPERIQEKLGQQVKFVVILRNPVDMVYSLWGHNVRKGFETESFEKALDLEAHRSGNKEFSMNAPCWVENFLYTQWARYSTQLETYFDLFPRENFRIYIFEEFFLPGLPLYTDLLEFLGVDATQKIVEKVHNPAGNVRSKLLRKILSERHAWKEPLKVIVPKRLRNKITSFASNLNRTRKPFPPVNQNTRCKLEQEMNKDVRRLECLLDRDLSEIWF